MNFIDKIFYTKNSIVENKQLGFVSGRWMIFIVLIESLGSLLVEEYNLVGYINILVFIITIYGLYKRKMWAYNLLIIRFLIAIIQFLLMLSGIIPSSVPAYGLAGIVVTLLSIRYFYRRKYMFDGKY